ncbi:MAG TPA: M3 family metallopeptidase [Candidatus Eisenbacteria bacterium]|nr:M3 family metallopeptidase [Candidatus Eisenbacteria bacterium]
MFHRSLFLSCAASLAAGLLMVLVPGTSDAAAAAKNPPLFYRDRPDAAAFRTASEGELKEAEAALARLLAVKGKRTVENTLKPYNEVVLHADNAAYQAGLMESVHPDSGFRSTAEGVTQAAQKFLSALSLNRGVYDAIQAVDVSKEAPDTRYLVERTLRDFRRSGVDKDDATRAKITALREELVKIGQEFDKNIRNDSRFIELTSVDELKGLPEDYIKSHQPGPDGKIKISIEYPDRFPVMNYAENGEVRRRLYMERMNRAYPQNMEVLDRMIAKRHELAQLLGYKTWADYVTEDKMIKSAARVSEFIDRLSALTVAASKEEYKIFLKARQADDPKATTVENWEYGYYSNKVKKRDYDFDSREARPYFAFTQVKKGVMDVTSKIFGVSFKKIDNATVWHPTVDAYEVWDGGKMIGRFFLDLHPRPGKFNHAAQFLIRQGCAGYQLPEAVLVCNFPGDEPNDPGLMEPGDVETFFHEFGHLLHSIFAGGQRWEPLAGISTEWDFVEAPSQILEEWVRYPSSLQSFAKHYQTGEPIPTAMVEKMRRSDAFGRATDTAFQVLLTTISLRMYDKEPSKVNTDKVVEEAEVSIMPFPRVPNTHFQTSFGHLDGYSAIYYTYQWSLVIAKDLFSKFDTTRMLDPAVPTQYRKTILAAGGTKPAETLVHDFLKRDFDYKAYEAYLREGVK